MEGLTSQRVNFQSMYVDRKRLEEIETLTLAPYAQHSGKSRGRVHPEPEPDYRTAFQRDRDRITHSAAFRRLEYKTQVFVNDSGDYYRTRLTHTLEVAQIGRTVARAIGANEDLVETICLAHDLGHPPFGHAGEHILNQLMQGHGGFNHNQQGYRVVTELERRYDHWQGLNLTYETLEGMADHGLTDGERRPSLEAQIADAVDEIAYNAHDLDDGLVSGILLLEQVQALTLWQQVTHSTGWQGKILDNRTRHKLIRELVGVLVGDFIHATAARLQQYQPQSPQQIKHLPENVAAFSASMQTLNAELKAFLRTEMLQHYRVVRMSQRAEYFLTQMFNTYLKAPRQLPPETFTNVEIYSVQRVIADYIASLTDRSALLEYRRLFDPSMSP